MTFDVRGLREPAAMLLCLDALEPVGANLARLPAPAWRGGAAALLAHARTHAWPIVHVLRGRPAPGQGGWRPAPGLTPLPAEPLFHREMASAFGAQGFADAVAGTGGRRLAIVGCSADGACLATALDGLRIGLRLLLPMDALGLPARERSGLEGLKVISARAPDVQVTLTDTRRLLGAAPEMRVLRGGRA